MSSTTKSKASLEDSPSPNLPGNLPQIYADGIGQVMVGMPVSKLVFHRTVNTNPNNDVDRPVAVVTMPTAAILEFVLAFNDMAKSHGTGLLNALDEQSVKTRALIDRFLQQATDIQVEPSPPPAKKTRTKR